MDKGARALLITDRRRTAKSLPELVAQALQRAAPGSVMVQLREKDLDARALAELARALLPVCSARRAPLLVNGRLDVALALNLDGVHLPANGFEVRDARSVLPPGKILGVSCHSIAEVAAAHEGGADYAVFGPLFDTASKREMGAPLGLEPLRTAAALGLPLFGLGGVTIENAAAVRAAGAQGVAAIGAWMDAKDSAEEVLRLSTGGP